MTRSRHAIAGAWTFAAALLLASTAARAELLPPGDCAGVYWDLTSVFESGDRVYARVLLTAVGPGARNAASLGHWIDSAGQTTPFQNGRREGRFELDPAGPRLRIGSTRFDGTGPVPFFEVDNDKRGVKLRLELAGPIREALATRSAEGLEITLLALGAETSARLWRSGMQAPREVRGWTTLLRTRHGECERDLAARRVDVHRLGASGALVWVQQELVSGERVGFLRSRDGAGVRVVPLEFDGRSAGSEEEWPLPAQLRVNGPGARGAIRIHAPHLSIDPLDALPRLVRMLYSFGARPRRLWADASFDLVWDPELSESFGPGSPPERPPKITTLAIFTFLRPPE